MVLAPRLELTMAAHQHDVAPALDFDLDRETKEESKSVSTSTENISKNSLIHLRSITSAPALANKPISIASKPKAEDALSSCGLSYLDDFAEQTAASFPVRQSTSPIQHSGKSR